MQRRAKEDASKEGAQDDEDAQAKAEEDQANREAAAQERQYRKDMERQKRQMNLEPSESEAEAELAKMRAQIEQLKRGGQAQGGMPPEPECRVCPLGIRRSRCSESSGTACADDERDHQQCEADGRSILAHP